jgi:hypothetical protein
VRTGPPELQLVKEDKVHRILGARVDPRLEASGVLARDGRFYVIFDNLPHIACLGDDLSPTSADNHLIEQHHGHKCGFEDIAYDRSCDRFYVLIEALPRGPRRFMAAVQEYDGGFRYLSTSWLDFPLDRPNKGLEGLTCVRRDGESLLLGLCEGNRGEGGGVGRTPGEGRIQIFRKGRHHWHRVGTIELPKTLWLVDYSGISVVGDKMAVVSQVSSALWIGRLLPSSWQIADEGTIYTFPRDDQGEIVYCTIEGVSWIANDQIVVVSDKAKPTQGKRCRARDQSIHIFRIPNGSVSTSHDAR